jgi:hypothetical protein
MAITSDSGWDLSIKDRNGQLVLAVQIKRKTNASPNWAAAFRRNILAHGIFPSAPYFLMVFPDRFYLWVDTQARLDQTDPTYTIDARPILQPYLERAGVTADQISGQSLEIIIASWLGELIHSEHPPEPYNNSLHWLVESGLYNALAGGRFDHEAAA